jgi:hypothetical protein
LFRFDKFSSFLHGTFGAPHLVIKKKEGKSKGTVQNHKKKEGKKQQRKGADPFPNLGGAAPSWQAAPPYLVRPSFLIQHR